MTSVRTQMDILLRVLTETVNDYDLHLIYVEAAYETGTITIKVTEGGL